MLLFWNECSTLVLLYLSIYLTPPFKIHPTAMSSLEGNCPPKVLYRYIKCGRSNHQLSCINLLQPSVVYL